MNVGKTKVTRISKKKTIPNIGYDRSITAGECAI